MTKKIWIGDPLTCPCCDNPSLLRAANAKASTKLIPRVTEAFIADTYNIVKQAVVNKEVVCRNCKKGIGTALYLLESGPLLAGPYCLECVRGSITISPDSYSLWSMKVNATLFNTLERVEARVKVAPQKVVAVDLF